MLRPSHHVELARYAHDMVTLATSRQLVLLAKYLQTHLSDIERWMRDMRIAINVSKSSVMIFTKAGRHIPTSSSFRGTSPLGPYRPLSWGDPRQTAHLVDSRRSAEEESGTEPGIFGTSPEEKEGLSLHQEWSSAVQAAHPSSNRLRLLHLEVVRSLPCQETTGAAIQASSHCYQCTFVHW